MNDISQKMTFDISARRINSQGSEAACMIKGIERVTPILKFELRGVDIRLHGIRQDVPPRMESIDYEILVDTDETDARACSPDWADCPFRGCWRPPGCRKI